MHNLSARPLQVSSQQITQHLNLSEAVWRNRTPGNSSRVIIPAVCLDSAISPDPLPYTQAAPVLLLTQ